MELFFRISEAARELGISSNALRRLIEAGQVKGQTMPGGHLRIAASEVERLKRDGIPSAPRPLPNGTEAAESEDGPIRPAVRPTTRGIIPSSVEAAESEPEVVGAAAAVRILEHETRAGELRQKLEEQQDWWRGRKKLEAAEREANEAHRRDQETASQRQDWRESGQTYALQRIPAEAPAEIRQVIYANVTNLLDSLNPRPSTELTRRLIEAEVQKHLRPWKRGKEVDAIIKSTVDHLPTRAKSYGTMTTWQTRALRAARASVNALPDSAEDAEIAWAAEQAVQPIAVEFAAHELREEVVGRTSRSAGILPLTERGKETAQRAIVEAVSSLPTTASRLELESAAEKALTPYQVAVEQQQAEEGARHFRSSAARATSPANNGGRSYRT
jgi:excisionase family DNA binding protein